ncbi:MAG: AAA family ATPase, partial [Streptococcaceae bacterium]|nr:AAA family ATPase [Streptococcaceae bacterium]
DEIEKAHPDIMHAFLQILDDGRLTDAQGRTVSFKDAIIIMTSNIGSNTTESSVGFGATLSGTTKSVLNQLHNYFTPEFLNRFDGIIEFKSLSKKILLSIVSLMLNEVNEQLAAQKLKIDVPKDIQEKIVELGHNPDMGARPLRRIIQEKIEDKIADFYLEHPEEKELTTTMVNDEIIVQSKNKSLASTPTAAVKNKSEKKKLSKNEK